MKPLFILLATLLVYASVNAMPQRPPPPKQYLGFEDDQNVIVLRHTNIEKAFTTFSHLLVVFHAHWCQPCKTFVPEFIRTAATLRQTGSKITLGKVDCTLEKELVEKYEIKSYPTVKFFLNGKMTNYTGGRTEPEILNWVAKTTKLPCIQVENLPQLEDVMAANDVVVVYWGTWQSEAFQAYESASREAADLPYVFTVSPEVQAKYRGSPNNQVSLIRAFEERVVHLREEFNIVNLKKFVKENRYPLIMQFNTQHAKRVFGDKNPLLILVTGNEHQENQQLWTEFVAAAKELKGKILMGTVPIGTDWGQKIIDHLGGSHIKLPTIAILKPLEYQTDKYILKGTVTADDIIKFYNNFKEKKIFPSLRTAPAPKTQTGPVTVVVGKTFKEIVNNPQKDVFLFIYAPWCRHSQETTPIIEELAQHVSSIKNLLIAKLDGTANEIEGIRVANVPYILFFPANNKSRPSLFKGLRTLQGFWSWIESYLTVDYDKSLIPEILASSTTDEDQTSKSGWENVNREPGDIRIASNPGSPMMPSLAVQDDIHRESPQGFSPQTITAVNQVEISEPEENKAKDGNDGDEANDADVDATIDVNVPNDDNGVQLGGDDL